jgi:hypothetical protein
VTEITGMTGWCQCERAVTKATKNRYSGAHTPFLPAELGSVGKADPASDNDRLRGGSGVPLGETKLLMTR